MLHDLIAALLCLKCFLKSTQSGLRSVCVSKYTPISHSSWKKENFVAVNSRWHISQGISSAVLIESCGVLEVLHWYGC